MRELFAGDTSMRSTTCVTPSMPRATVSARCLAALVGNVPCSTTTPFFAVTSNESALTFFIWLSDASCDLMRVANASSASALATDDFPAAFPAGEDAAGVVEGGAGDAVAAGGAGAAGGGTTPAAGGADPGEIVKLSSTRLTPSVVRASNSASARSVSSATAFDAVVHEVLGLDARRDPGIVWRRYGRGGRCRR